MFNILILEDEEIARRNLIKTLKTLEYDVEILEAAKGAEAIEIAQSKEIDLFFLDIEVEDISGIKVAETLREMKQYELSYIVFITTHAEYMLSAFKQFHCYDFLEKPFSKEEVLNLTKLIMGNMKQRKKELDDKKNSITIEFKQCVLRLYTDKILFVEVIGRECVVHTKNKKYNVPYIPLKKMKDFLTEENFIQSHKSFIVNVNYIEKIEKQTEILSEIYFYNYDETALIGKKFINMILRHFEKNN